MAHSPSPWRAALGDEWRTRADESEMEIACLPHNTCDAIDVFGPEIDRELTAEELMANARLIAAAPDMLEALRAVALVLPKYAMKGDTPSDDEALDAVTEQVSEAILKATGT